MVVFRSSSFERKGGIADALGIDIRSGCYWSLAGFLVGYSMGEVRLLLRLEQRATDLQRDRYGTRTIAPQIPFIYDNCPITWCEVPK